MRRTLIRVLITAVTIALVNGWQPEGPEAAGFCSAWPSGMSSEICTVIGGCNTLEQNCLQHCSPWGYDLQNDCFDDQEEGLTYFQCDCNDPG